MDSRLHTAVRFGKVSEVMEALKDGLNPNEIGLFKWSPVHEAANNGERDILKLLIAHKGDVNLQEKLHGNTPLHYAAREDNSACVTVLLKAGARTDIKNFEGMTCLDEATSLCREIIWEFVLNNRCALTDWKGDDDHHKGMNMNEIQAHEDYNHTPDIPEQAAIGQIHLSFDYHKMNLKIRVWQVSDLLLPPPQISMIDSIFVRSYLIPDTAKKSNRQTEEVQVEPHLKDPVQFIQSGVQHIFTPSSFRFETPLVYTGLTQDIIAERSLRLEVCMTQKYTHKIYLMAMVHMPLRTAVRHPIREKYLLIPCMNYTIPNNMRVYRARDIISETTSIDQPLSRSGSVYSNFSSSLATKDVHLEGAGNLLSRFPKQVSDSDGDDDDGVGNSTVIKSSHGMSAASSTATTVMSLITDNEETSAFVRESTLLMRKGPSGGLVDMDNKERPETKKKIIPNELFGRDIDLDDYTADTYKDIRGPAVLMQDYLSRCNVEIGTLKSDVISTLKLDSTSDERKHKANLVQPQSKKKKIIPPELLTKTVRIDNMSKKSEKCSDYQNFNKEVASHETLHNGCFHYDIQSTDKNGFPINTSKTTHSLHKETAKIVDNEDGKHNNGSHDENKDHDIVSEVGQVQQQSISESFDTGLSLSSVSRPETPVWDFYDFAMEEGTEADAGSSERVIHLSQTSKTLDTLKVTGPMLPAIMIEDFEMDAENEDDTVN